MEFLTVEESPTRHNPVMDWSCCVSPCAKRIFHANCLSWCYNFFLTHVEHTFSSSFLDYLTLAATCAEGSLFISALLFT